VRLMACKPTRLRILFSATSHRCCQTRNSVVNLGLRTETLSLLDSFQGEGGTCHVFP
ncbi:Fusaridione A cluster transcription factor fsdR, partial [Fusarium oxysporum f. sp. albedinis]